LIRWAPHARGGLLAATLALLALVAAGLTYAALTSSAPFAKSKAVLYLLLSSNLVIVLALAGLIAWLLVRVKAARRSGVAGTKLHSRLVGLFGLIAAVPAIIVAVFSAVFLFINIESWFSARQRSVIDSAEMVTEAYFREHQLRIMAEAIPIAEEIDRQGPFIAFDPNKLTDLLRVVATLRAVPGVYIIKRDGSILAGVKLDPDLEYVPPLEQALQEAELGKTAIYAAYSASQVHGLKRLAAFPDAYLYVVRYVDPRVVDHLRETRKARSEYERAESRRTLMPIYFFVVYLVVALFILLAAVWLGIWAANRIVAPIGRLIGASERVSRGDLSVRVAVGPTDDEIGSLGRAFNRMTAQLETQREELVEANRQLDRRRRFTEAVLSGVTAGVIGLDGEERITLVNRSGLQLLGTAREKLIGEHFARVVPEMAPLVRAAQASADRTAQGQVELIRAEGPRNFTVRVMREVSGEDDLKGFVVTFDDITELMAAQRMSAWADVARRIAHEIKNPLTPIQLSAERLRRKYRTEVREPDIFEQCTNTIIRQVGDIGRMVDEFSSFARMPAPVMTEEDLADIARQAVFLQRVAHPDIEFSLVGADTRIEQTCDRRLVTQALTNIIKNAVEAIAARRESEPNGGYRGQVRVKLSETAERSIIEIMDNGCGLPREQRHLLTEPYVTTRVKGTGLGLAIVKKIMEDHGASLALEDSPGENGERRRGALVRLSFPKTPHEAVSAESVQEGVGYGG
jgi:two-component system nitrogen regulation sensor histidine kinase NtrY